jgi:hypothetical protein
MRRQPGGARPAVMATATMQEHLDEVVELIHCLKEAFHASEPSRVDDLNTIGARNGSARFGARA